jgi:hypothetical protein
MGKNTRHFPPWFSVYFFNFTELHWEDTEVHRGNLRHCSFAYNKLISILFLCHFHHSRLTILRQFQQIYSCREVRNIEFFAGEITFRADDSSADERTKARKDEGEEIRKEVVSCFFAPFFSTYITVKNINSIVLKITFF